MVKGRKTSALKFGDEYVYPGERKKISLRVAALYDFTDISIPIEVIRGKEPGPTLFICAAIHGDELNGVEIIRRLLRRSILKRLRGTLIAVPIVNVFGFNNRSRYLPDRRDLNRSFPGSKEGSLASRLAHTFMREVIRKSTHGIDLHTGAIHRKNLPQLRVSMDDPESVRLADAFGVPVIINSTLRDGSLREAARKRKIPILVYEGGEALRFEESIIRTGLSGCLSVMRSIRMLPPSRSKKSTKKPVSSSRRSFFARESYWIRAPHSGAYAAKVNVGDRVEAGDTMASISDPFGTESFKVIAPERGILIGESMIPLVNQGDAMFHLATFKNSKIVKRALENFEDDSLQH